MSELDDLRERAKVSQPRAPTDEQVETRYQRHLEKGIQVDTIKRLAGTAEWKLFVSLLELMELEPAEVFVIRDPVNKLLSERTDIMVGIKDGAPEREPAKVDMPTLEAQRWYWSGVAWGIRKALTFPTTLAERYEKAQQARLRQQQLGSATTGKPLSGIDTSPVEGGAQSDG